MKNGARTILLVIGDICMLVASFFLMLIIRFPEKISHPLVNSHIFPFVLVFLVWILVFFLFNLYEKESIKANIPHLRTIGIASMVALASSTILFYVIPTSGISPKTNLVIFSIIFVILFVIWRRIFYHIFSSYFRKSIIFIVDREKNKTEVGDLEGYIKMNPQSGFIITAFYDSFEQFLKNHKGGHPDVFIVCREIWRNPEYFKILHNTKSEIWDLAYAYEDIMSRIPIEAIDEGWFMHNTLLHQKGIYFLIKRIVGIIAATVIMIIVSPFFLLVSLAIKLYDDGPVLYSQVRVGKYGKNFKLYKFRSMIANAEKNGPAWSAENDPRITPVGKILRKTHIDELPQFLNIIKGDIALVGPRPERPEFTEDLARKIPFYYLRHTIAPGFTGWAQIKFRYARTVMDSQKKFEYDLYYIKNRNIFMDLGILLRTIQIIFTH